MDSLIHDIRFGLRSLRKDRRFTFTAIVALALGIGVTTVIFSVIDGVLLRPFPYKGSNRLTTVYEHFVSGALDLQWLEPEEVVDFKEQNHSFEDLTAFSLLEVFYNGREGTQWVVGGRVTPNTFDFLGVKPLLGRPIGLADGNPSAPPVFAMSYRMWEKEFNGDPKIVGTLLPTIRREILAIDPNVALILVNTLESHLKESSYTQPRFGVFTLGTFAGTGLLLVLIGVFSVMAYTVSLQRHEIGIRMALGAQPSDVSRMVLKKGLGLIAGGIVIGVLASLGLMRFLASQIWGVSATDPWTFGAVTIIILAVGLIATFLPAHSAAQVDAMITLRSE